MVHLYNFISGTRNVDTYSFCGFYQLFVLATFAKKSLGNFDEVFVTLHLIRAQILHRNPEFPRKNLENLKFYIIYFTFEDPQGPQVYPRALARTSRTSISIYFKSDVP